MQFLRQSTASQSVTIGAFVDDTDGKTPETGLTIANTDIKLIKNGGAPVNKNSGGATHRINGQYGITLDATDTNTVGRIRVSIKVAGGLSVWEDFVILEEAVFDLWFAAAATGDVKLQGVTHTGATIPTVTTVGNMRGTDSAATAVALAIVDGNVDDIQTRIPAALIGGRTDANVGAIDSDTVAPVGLKNQYDGVTGVIGDTYPSSQSQVASIGTISGGGQPFEMIADNTGGAIKGVTFVGVQTGTFTNTEAEDDVYHVIDDTGNAIDIVYRTNVGGSRIASKIDWKGFLSNVNDSLNIQLYDFVGADWETVRILDGQAGPNNIILEVPVLLKHTGEGADLGDVLIRFVGSGLTNPQLNTDLLHVQAVGATSALGFEDGAVWLNTGSGTSGVGEGVGFYTRPSDNITDALAIAVANNLKKIHSLPSSSFILPSSAAGLEFNGFSYTVTLNGKSVSGSLLEGAAIIGNDDGSNAIATVYRNCTMGSNTLGLHILEECILAGDIILAEPGEYLWKDPKSFIAGGGAPSVDFQSAVETKALNVRGIFGGLEIRNYNAGGGTHTMTLGGTGQRIFAASCAGGSLEQRGQFKETDNAGDAVTVVRDKVSQGIIDVEVDTAEIGIAGIGLTAVSLISTGLDAIVSTATGMVEMSKAVWDRIISKDNHDIGQSAGKILRISGDLIQIDGAVSDISPSVGGFDTTLTQADGYFNDATLTFSNGAANKGIGFPISLYVNANGHVTFDAPDQLPVTPVNGDDFVIIALHTHPVGQIADAVADEPLSGHTTAGTLGKVIADIEIDTDTDIPALIAALAADLAVVDAIVDAILVNTGTTIPALLAVIDGNVDAILIDTSTDIPALIAALAVDLATVDANVDAILVDTSVTIPALITALNNITVAEIFAGGDVDGFTLEQTLKIILSSAAAKVSGAATTTMIFRAADDSKDRITATVDGVGNRSAVTLDGTG